MHLFSWQSIDWSCKPNVHDLVTVVSTLSIESVLLDEQMLSLVCLVLVGFFFADICSVQVTEWLGLVAGVVLIWMKVIQGTSHNTTSHNTTWFFFPYRRGNCKKNVCVQRLVEFSLKCACLLYHRLFLTAVFWNTSSVLMQWLPSMISYIRVAHAMPEMGAGSLNRAGQNVSQGELRI